MSKVIKNYWISIIFALMVGILTLTSTWVKEIFLLPNIFYKGATLFVYLPFGAAILWKMLSDIKNISIAIKKTTNIIFYGLAVFYGVLLAYRFLNSLEIKENLYYSIIFFGSVALYMLLSEKYGKTKNMVGNNVVAISTIIAAVRLIEYFMVGKLFLAYPINMNIMTGISVLTIPFLIDYFKTATSKKTKIFTLCLICLIILEVLTSSARMMCALLIVVLLVQLVINIKNKEVFKKLLTTCLCALLVIVLMFVCNVKNTRYAIYREFTFVKTAMVWIDEIAGTTMSDDTLDEEEEKVEATEQMQRSDAMRSDLMNMGIAEIKKNPLLGTGNVTYLYDVSGYTFEQSSHNFLIEALVCYGIIGVLGIVALIISAIYKSKIISRKNKGPWQNKISILLTFAVFFAMGCLQPLVFNILVCPVFMIIFAVYDMTAQENLKIKE